MSQTVVAFGGGTNSTALLVGLHERGERPDAIVFADTGGEQRHTYEHVNWMRQWCINVRFPELVTVQATFNGVPHTLEEHSLRTRTLPSLAYGLKSCSRKFKRDPSDKWCRARFPTGTIVKLIGYDAGEPHRAERATHEKGRFVYRYPLIEWGWDREACIAAIDRYVIPRPGKSSCFFCPAMKVREIHALPCDLKARAIAMEENADLTSIAGLGRRFAWKDLLAQDAAQGKLYPEIETACECYDGDDEPAPAQPASGARLCRICVNAYNRAWRAKDIEKSRAYYRERSRMRRAAARAARNSGANSSASAQEGQSNA